MVKGQVEFEDDGFGERTPGNGLDPRLITANEFVDGRGCGASSRLTGLEKCGDCGMKRVYVAAV